MKYRRVTQTANVYEYGKGKMFRNKKMAMEEAERVRKAALKDIHEKHREMAEIKIIEVAGAVQLLLQVYVPIKEKN